MRKALRLRSEGKIAIHLGWGGRTQAEYMYRWKGKGPLSQVDITNCDADVQRNIIL